MQVSSLFYFGFFLIVMPLLGLFETPRRVPNSITEAVLGKEPGNAISEPEKIKQVQRAS